MTVSILCAHRLCGIVAFVAPAVSMYEADLDGCFVVNATEHAARDVQANS